jgi:hypothetical protein
VRSLSLSLEQQHPYAHVVPGVRRRPAARPVDDQLGVQAIRPA